MEFTSTTSTLISLKNGEKDMGRVAQVVILVPLGALLDLLGSRLVGRNGERDLPYGLSLTLFCPVLVAFGPVRPGGASSTTLFFSNIQD